MEVICFIGKSITERDYQDLIQTKLLPPTVYITSWILQDESATPHYKWMQQVRNLPSLDSSPDLKQVENVGDYANSRVRGNVSDEDGLGERLHHLHQKCE